MYFTIFLVIIGLIGFVAMLALPKAGVPGGRLVGLGVMGLAGILTALSCTTIVQAKEVGVLTTFGKPADRTLSSGLSVKAPWQDVTTIDGTIQTDKYETIETCIEVRIGDGTAACAELTNRWQIADDKANVIYADYRKDANGNAVDDPVQAMADAVVNTQLTFAVQEVLASYNPINELEVAGEDGGASVQELNFSPDYAALGEKIKGAFEARPSSDLVEIQDITLSYIHLSDTTQDTIDSFIKEVGLTRTAAQARLTASQLAAANRELASSLEGGSGVAQLRCLETVGVAIEKNYSLPGGFSCIGGGSSGVLVDGKTAQPAQ